MKYLEDVDYTTPDFGDFYDELPLWSAPFGRMLLGHRFVRLGFVPGWKAVAPQDAVEETLAALERRLNDVAAERGELSLTVPGACIHARKPAPE